MLGHILIVHNDQDVATRAENALKAAGYQVQVCQGVVPALSVLQTVQVDLLITRMRFPPGGSNGVALALMARRQHPDIKILFTASPEHQDKAAGLGTFLEAPVSIPDLLDAVNRLMRSPLPLV